MRLAVAAGWLAIAGSLPAFQATGSIEGQIFNLATGAPLKRATVRLMTTGGGGRGGLGRGAGPQMRETDEQGRFAFLNLDAGRYQLAAERQGFLRQNYGGRKYNTSGTPIVLAKDQQVGNIVMKMSPQSVIAGRVLDEDGEPVANIQVRAYQMGYRSGKRQWVQVGGGSANDIGEYRIPALEPGKYLVATSQSNRPFNFLQVAGPAPPPDTPDLRYASTYYPSTIDQANAVPVEATVGAETRGIDIRLVKARVFRVRGRVAVNVEGARPPYVTLISREGGRTFPGIGPARPPDHRFDIPGVPPGSYIVYAQLGDRQQQLLAMQPIEVRNQHIDGLVLSPSPAGDVSGTIKVDDANGPVDLSRVAVVLRPSPDLVSPPRGRVANGAFALKNVVPLRYSIAVNQLPDGCFLKSVHYGGREVLEDGVDIAPGGVIEITLSAAAGSIAASVVDKDGKAVSGATVALIPKEGGAARGSTADENGAASFSGIKPGDYTVIAWDDIPQGAYMDPEFVKAYSGAAVKLEPRGRQSVQVKVSTVE